MCPRPKSHRPSLFWSVPYCHECVTSLNLKGLCSYLRAREIENITFSWYYIILCFYLFLYLFCRFSFVKPVTKKIIIIILWSCQLLFPPQVITQPLNIMTLLICKGKCAPAISWRFVYNFMLTKDNVRVVEFITFEL